jgi:hypothetical protein
MFILMLDVIEELTNPLILARPGTRSSSHECKPTCVGRWLFCIVEGHETAWYRSGLRDDGSYTGSSCFMVKSDFASTSTKEAEASLSDAFDQRNWVCVKSLGRSLQGLVEQSFPEFETRSCVSGLREAGIKAASSRIQCPRISLPITAKLASV